MRRLDHRLPFTVSMSRAPFALPGARRIPQAAACVFAVVLAALVFGQAVYAQNAVTESDADSGQSLEEQSLALRTALHHDSTLESPLERLIVLYREAGRIQELVGLYRTHVAQYPADANGRTVLVRLLLATGDPSALTAAQNASTQFSKNAYLHYLLFRTLKQRNDPKALDELDLAIENESRPSRKMSWLEELLPEARVRDRRELSLKHLKVIAAIPRDADQRLVVGRMMNRYEFFELGLDVLTKTDGPPAAPETMVDLELEAATSEVGLDKPDVAAERLRKLLGRLAADYWRRSDIVRRRLALVTSPEKRDEIISAARKRADDSPRDEAAILDLAQTLSALQFRREALQTLTEAGKRLPGSQVIEQRTLEFFDRLRDERGRDEYLQARIKQQPERADLVLMRVKSLYLLGQREAADPLFDELIEPMSRKEKAVQVLEMARFLRRSSLPSEAATLLEQVLKLDPDRIDVRRELAETRLALGQRHKVADAFAEAIPAEAPVEEVLDLVQFMMQQKLLLEAGGVIRDRLKKDDANLDLRLLLINVERRMGRLATGSQLIEESRELADTGARYRAWLESAVAFFDEFDAVAAFLFKEEQRIQDERGEWTERQLERRLAFAEVAASNDRSEHVAALLRQDLQDDVTPLMRLALRRKLIDVLDDEADQATLVEEELNRLAQEDPESSSEYFARLALLYKRQKREDRAVAVLQKVDPVRIRDATLLSGLLTAFQQRQDHRQLLIRILERLTAINPGDRGNWERWLTALAATGDEERLRVELRRLLAGIKELTIDEDTRELLQLYVADSYWRSIAGGLRSNRRGAMADVLPLLDSIERMTRSDQQWLWMNWIRAFALNRLDNEKARDEAIGELERKVASLTVESDVPGAPISEPRIVFPDGVSVSSKHARRLLTTTEADPKPPVLHNAQGPIPGLRARWSWSPGAGIAAIHPIDDVRVLIGDYSGAVSCVDSASGKLIWSRDAVMPAWSANPNQQQYFNLSIQRSSLSKPGFQILLMQGSQADSVNPDRFCIGGLSDVSCYSLKDGKLLWRADVGSSARPPGIVVPRPTQSQATVSVFSLKDEHELLTWDPIQLTLARVDPISGKVLWYRVLENPALGQSTANNSGSALNGDQLLVYGSMTAIINIRNGEKVWSFEPHTLRSFPVSLEEKDSTTVASTATPPIATGMVPTMIRTRHGYTTSYAPQPYQIQQMQSGMVSHSSTSQIIRQYAAFGTQNPSANPWQFTSQSPLALTSSAVMWAGNARRGSFSHASFQESRVTLYQNGQIHSVDLELPLSSKTIAGQGFLIGTAGRSACFLTHNSQLNLVDLKTGMANTFQPTEILPKQGSPPGLSVQAAMDGMLVYLTGQRGIVCVNVKTGERVFGSPWPESIKPAEPLPGTSTAGAINSSYLPIGSYSSTSQTNPKMTSVLARVHNGVLYTLTAADTVVALEGASVDGR